MVLTETASHVPLSRPTAPLGREKAALVTPVRRLEHQKRSNPTRFAAPTGEDLHNP